MEEESGFMHGLRDLLPNAALFVLMVACALVLDGVLHVAGAARWGRSLGYAGTLLLLVSFVYSARKRRWLRAGKARHFLRAHELLAWVGSMMILVHAGIHFNALLPWLATGAMLIAVASGLTGKYLLATSTAAFRDRREAMSRQGLAKGDIDERLFWDAAVVDLMKKWRAVHLPITGAFAFLALLHVISILVFWAW